MTEASRKIFEFLSAQSGFVPEEKIAVLLQTKKRQLRRNRNNPGVLVIAGREIFKEHGYCIISRMKKPSGIKLSNNPSEIEAASDQWHGWVRPILNDKIQYMNRCAAILRGKPELAV